MHITLHSLIPLVFSTHLHNAHVRLFYHPSDALEMLFKSEIILAFFLHSIQTVLRQVLHTAAISLGISWCPLQLLGKCLLVLTSCCCWSIVCFVAFLPDLTVCDISWYISLNRFRVVMSPNISIVNTRAKINAGVVAALLQSLLFFFNNLITSWPYKYAGVSVKVGLFCWWGFFYYLCFLVLVFGFFLKVSQTSIWLGRCKEAAFLVLNLTYWHLGFFYLYLVFIFLKDFALYYLYCSLFMIFLDSFWWLVCNCWFCFVFYLFVWGFF